MAQFLSEIAAAVAMSASIGEQDSVVVPDKPNAITGNAQSIVSDAMKQNDSVAIRLGRSNFPGTQNCAIGGGHADFNEFGVFACGGNDFLFFGVAD